jgi:hypothetical protein
MSEPETKQAANQSSQQERCVCREVMDHFREAFGVPPEVRNHFNNSRIELLKAIRAIIDNRIEHLSRPSAHGTKIAVE